MTGPYDVIVLGVGAMGAATCDQLAGRGLRVLGLERFDVPHALGSSGGQSRLVRLAYYEHPDYVPLLRRAYENWDDLGERSGRRVLYRCGCLYLGPEEGHLVSGVRRSRDHHRDLQVEDLDRADLAGRFPAFEVPESYSALFEPEAGFVLAEQSIAAFVDQALRRGADIRTREAVAGWSADDTGVRVVTERGTYDAGRLVITAGAWTPDLLADLGVDLRVTRQCLGWVWPKSPERYELGKFPCWAIEDDAPGFKGIYYGFPLLPVETFGGERGLKLAHHYPGATASPETLERTVSEEDEEDFRPALRRYLPGAANGATLAARACMYTMTPDQHFILGLHPEAPRVALGCGFSGHGFKFASVVGEALADLATDGTSSLPIGFLGLERLLGG